MKEFNVRKESFGPSAFRFIVKTNKTKMWKRKLREKMINYWIRLQYYILVKNAAIANNRYFLVFSPAVEKLEIVECDLEKRDQIGKALGNASVVLCCIGASEKEVFDITGPYRIDYLATKNLIEAGEHVYHT